MDFEVKLIEDGTGFGRRLGITPERLDVISDVMVEAFKNNHEFIDAIAEASKVAIHQNELAFICFAFGAQFGESRNPANMLISILKSVKK